MSHRTHDLAHEFPEFKERIHTLKTSDNHFKHLSAQYEQVTSELHRFSEGAGGIDDAHAEELKKKRLALKDKLFAMLSEDKKPAGGCCGSC